jgi:hypothetical protein
MEFLFITVVTKLLNFATIPKDVLAVCVLMFRPVLCWRDMNIYCNGFDQRFARQQLRKHGPTRNNRGGCVLRVRGDITTVDIGHVTSVSCDACPFLDYISDRFVRVRDESVLGWR